MAGGEGQRRRAAWRREEGGEGRMGRSPRRGPAGLGTAPTLAGLPQGRGAGAFAAPSPVCRRRARPARRGAAARAVRPQARHGSPINVLRRNFLCLL